MSEIFKNESRKDWHRDGEATNDDLRVGCLQRIADATELMAKDRERMVRDLAYYEAGYRRRGEEINSLIRQRSALRGQITKLRKKDQP